MPVPGVRFLYLSCSDLDAMRRFYTDLIGMNEIYYSSDDRMLAYDCDGFQFTVLESKDVSPIDEDWGRQPGWSGGTGTTASWSAALTEDTYADAIERLKKADVPALHDDPVWVHYWSFPVRDPMGNTVEVTLAPTEAPPSTDWLG